MCNQITLLCRKGFASCLPPQLHKYIAITQNGVYILVYWLKCAALVLSNVFTHGTGPLSQP